MYEPVRPDDGGPHVTSVHVLNGSTTTKSGVELVIELDDGSFYVIDNTAGTEPDGKDNMFAVDSRAYGGKLEYAVYGGPEKNK